MSIINSDYVTKENRLILNAQQHSTNFELSPVDNQRLASLCGQFDEHLRIIEHLLNVKINTRGHAFHINGNMDNVHIASKILKKLYEETALDQPITPDHVQLILTEANQGTAINSSRSLNNTVQFKSQHGIVKPRGFHQKQYVENLHQYDINFGIGPAGTGKTYLAVACAVEAFQAQRVSRIILVRPAVEAGERLGFLPGDLTQKIDPYLRPLYDALYEMLGFERVCKLVERQIIEVAPLAYMRGRTLNDAFIILDESQNTTIEQMKMFLTRIGFNATVVITGDVTQIDLPRDKTSGLKHAMRVLEHVEGISFTFFNSKDVVRHPLVQQVINAYEKYRANSHLEK